jgi:dihydroorotase
MYSNNFSSVYPLDNNEIQRIVIRNGRLLDPSTGKDSVEDIALEGGKILKVGNIPADYETDREIDASGCWVTPGLLDLHVHLREPGGEDKETIDTGTAAAAAGGFTGVVSMPNTNPVTDTEAKIRYIKFQSEKSPCRVYPSGSITKGLKGEELSPFSEMIEAGAKAVSDDGRSVYRSDMLKNGLNYAKMFDIPVLCHCEDADLAKGAMNESEVSTRLGIPGIPTISEDIDVARHIMTAEYTGASIHICHVSSAGAIAQIRFGKERGVKVTAETAPHYFTYIDEDIGSYNTSRKMNPPLRGARDRAAVIEALKDGTLDIIASDHAPHTLEDKEGEFDSAAFGVVGLETMVAATITALVKTDIITPLEMVDKMSTTPHKILGVKGGTLQEGEIADITIIDPKTEWKVDSTQFFTKGRNCAFEGETLTGRSITTILGGQVVFEHN